jgi:hypothetical protein
VYRWVSEQLAEISSRGTATPAAPVPADQR